MTAGKLSLQLVRELLLSAKMAQGQCAKFRTQPLKLTAACRNNR